MISRRYFNGITNDLYHWNALMVTNNFISINKRDHDSFAMKIHESAFVIQFDAITLLVIRFCHTIQDISDFVIKYFEVSLKYL